MEQLSLPFPTLQFLASHAIGRCLVLMKVNDAYWYTNPKDSLRECELRVDKLPLRPVPKEYVKNVLRGLFEQVREWVDHNCVHYGADILCDARGNLDERRMTRPYFEKLYKGEFYKESFQRFARFLEYFCWYEPSTCNEDFLRIILDLQKVNTITLEGPEYRIVDEELEVVFRFVNHRRVTRRSAPPEFNVLLEWDIHSQLYIYVEHQQDLLVTYRVNYHYYNDDMIKIYADLLQPSEVLSFLKCIVYYKIVGGSVQHVFRFLNFVDPELRRDIVLSLNKADLAYNFLELCLIPGYESLFIPMMSLVGLNLDRDSHWGLFAALVDRTNLIGFDSLLLQFWQLLPESTKSELFEPLNDDSDGSIKFVMKNFAKTNKELFKVMFLDMSANLSKEQACNLLCVILI